jgi:hypothetical protein
MKTGERIVIVLDPLADDVPPRQCARRAASAQPASSRASARTGRSENRRSS